MWIFCYHFCTSNRRFTIWQRAFVFGLLSIVAWDFHRYINVLFVTVNKFEFNNIFVRVISTEMLLYFKIVHPDFAVYRQRFIFMINLMYISSVWIGLWCIFHYNQTPVSSHGAHSPFNWKLISILVSCFAAGFERLFWLHSSNSFFFLAICVSWHLMSQKPKSYNWVI